MDAYLSPTQLEKNPMITRKQMKLKTALRFSWKILLYSFGCALAAYLIYLLFDVSHISIPPSVVAILGAALAIILAFRNASAYERWWEARSLWGEMVNESRTFTRQALTVVDPVNIPNELLDACYKLVRGQIAWVNALRLQMRNDSDPEVWQKEVGTYFTPEEFAFFLSKSNKATHIGIHQGRVIKELNANGVLDTYSYIQIDDTLTRITAIQGDCERINDTPLPRPYDYYTRIFLALFILFFPFGMVDIFSSLKFTWVLVPITVVVGWMFYQIYVFGKILSRPFDNIETDVPMTSICRDIEIDLKEIIGDANIPEPFVSLNGVIH